MDATWGPCGARLDDELGAGLAWEALYAAVNKTIARRQACTLAPARPPPPPLPTQHFLTPLTSTLLHLRPSRLKYDPSHHLESVHFRDLLAPSRTITRQHAPPAAAQAYKLPPENATDFARPLSVNATDSHSRAVLLRCAFSAMEQTQNEHLH